MTKRKRWYDRLSVKITLFTAIVSFTVGLVSMTYKFAEDQTKKGLEINNNRVAIERIEKKVGENSKKLDKIIIKILGSDK